MEQTYILTVVVGFIGLVMGSFAGATVWRLRARQLVQDEAYAHELKQRKKSAKRLSPNDQAELDYLESSAAERSVELKRYKKLNAAKITNDRSQCLSCGHTLAWYDLIPLVSWLSTKGRCRYCKKPIGKFEPLMELGTTAVFVIFTIHFTGMFNMFAPAYFLLALWLAALTMLIILFTYDYKWFLLPDKVTYPLAALSVVIVFATFIFTKVEDIAAGLLSILFGVIILGGLYFVLWVVSKGLWVGFGDVKLGVVLGILLINWQLALLTLFLANLIGTLVVLPGLLTKKVSRTTQVPFGPFLIVGFFISLVWGQAILRSYDSFATWLSSVMLML